MLRRLLVLMAAPGLALITPSIAEAHFVRQVGYPLEQCNTALRRIEIDVTSQSLYIFENGDIIRQVNRGISTASIRRVFRKASRNWVQPWQARGCFRITGRTRLEYSQAFLAWMPYSMWFGGPGMHPHMYAIHQVPRGREPLLGTPASGGCVRVPAEIAPWLFDWAVEGTPVHIYGTWGGPAPFIEPSMSDSTPLHNH